MAGTSGGKFAVVRYQSNGLIDSSFGNSGYILINDSNMGLNNELYAMALQSDGSILLAGCAHNDSNSDFVIVKLSSDGTTLDTGFGTSGIVRIDFIDSDYAYAMALQSDGKILLAGYTNNSSNFDFPIVRYNTNGTLDNTFDGDGIVITNINNFDYAYDIAVQSDGKILIAGTSYNSTNKDFIVARYNSYGVFEGWVITDILGSEDTAYAIKLQSDGKILVAGTTYNGINNDFAVVRYE